MYKIHPDWKLSIAGGSKELATLEKKAKEMHLNNIYFEGFGILLVEAVQSISFCI